MASIKFYAVTGTGFFPVDMLRYDGAEPMNDAEAERVRDLTYDPGREETWQEAYERVRGKHSVCLMSDQRGAPVVERWRSFGWLVTNVKWGTDGYYPGPLDEPYEERPDQLMPPPAVKVDGEYPSNYAKLLELEPGQVVKMINDYTLMDYEYTIDDWQWLSYNGFLNKGYVDMRVNHLALYKHDGTFFLIQRLDNGRPWNG